MPASDAFSVFSYDATIRPDPQFDLRLPDKVHERITRPIFIALLNHTGYATARKATSPSSQRTKGPRPARSIASAERLKPPPINR